MNIHWKYTQIIACSVAPQTRDELERQRLAFVAVQDQTHRESQLVKEHMQQVVL